MSSSHCDLCGTEIVQGSCQNPDCENCSCVWGDDELLPKWTKEIKIAEAKEESKA